jgi:hypothetical protein
MNYSWHKKQRKITNTVINLMRELSDRAILFIEIDGKPIIEHETYYEINKGAFLLINPFLHFAPTVISHENL